VIHKADVNRRVPRGRCKNLRQGRRSARGNTAGPASRRGPAQRVGTPTPRGVTLARHTQDAGQSPRGKVSRSGDPRPGSQYLREDQKAQGSIRLVSLIRGPLHKSYSGAARKHGTARPCGAKPQEPRPDARESPYPMAVPATMKLAAANGKTACGRDALKDDITRGA
jgi:hypothetical protein